MRYYWKKQPEEVPCCGQVAVSIILKKSLLDTFRLFGHAASTDTKDLIRVLRSQKIKCDSHLQFTKKSNLAIAKVINPKDTQGWHWVVIWNNKVFDGVDGFRDGTTNWEKGCKITSYLNIY